MGIYIQSLGECDIANENLQLLKSEGADTGEFNCSAHITLVMTRSWQIALAIILSSYFQQYFTSVLTIEKEMAIR